MPRGTRCSRPSGRRPIACSPSPRAAPRAGGDALAAAATGWSSATRRRDSTAALRDTFPAAQHVRLPLRPGQRSLNLSNAVAVAVFDAWRQIGYAGGG